MAVLGTFCEPSPGRHVHRELLRSVLLDLTPKIPVTACHQRNYVERYSRYSQESFEPMGTHGYRIAIGGGTSPHNLRGSAVLKEDVKRYRKGWKAGGHPGEPTTVVR